jgi:hypothetical protein
MRTFMLAAVMAFPLADIAAAQMCGAPMQTGQSAQSGMSCMTPAQVDDPMEDKPAQQSAGMKCPCCKNMASMMGGMKHSTPAQEHNHQPTPKQ